MARSKSRGPRQGRCRAIETKRVNVGDQRSIAKQRAQELQPKAQGQTPQKDNFFMPLRQNSSTPSTPHPPWAISREMGQLLQNNVYLIDAIGTRKKKWNTSLKKLKTIQPQACLPCRFPLALYPQTQKIAHLLKELQRGLAGSLRNPSRQMAQNKARQALQLPILRHRKWQKRCGNRCPFRGNRWISLVDD